MPNFQSRVVSLTLAFALIVGLFAMSARAGATGAAAPLAAAPSTGTGVFVPHPVTPVFGTTYSTFGSVLGDIDGDGDLDAVMANAVSSSTSSTATVWVNNGAGRFSAHPTRPTFGTQYSQGVAMGDLDGDGDLDVILANKTSPSSIWLNDGTGRFSAHPTTPLITTGNAIEIALGDLDGDGDLDAVIAAVDSIGQTVWLNNGAGALTAHPTVPRFGGTDNRVVQLGDMDGDGDLDAVVGRGYSFADEVWLNNGTGAFAPHPTTPTFGNTTTNDLDLGDIDGDGDLDVVTASWNQPTPDIIRTDGPEAVWLNDGLGNMTPHPTTPTFGSGVSQDVGLADLDSDGDLDAMVANIHNQPETVWLNDGRGNFTAHPTMPSFGVSDSEEIEFGDLDGDGDLDALISAWTNHGASVWMNRDASALVAPTGVLTTTEAGGTATFGMRLGFAPTANVTILLYSSDPTEGYLSVNQVVFTPSTWAITQTITVTGLDDVLLDGDIAYTITTSLASSADPAYSGLAVADVSIINRDNDSAPRQTSLYLPRLMQPWAVAFNPQAIATRPVLTAGEVYYTATLTLAAPLPDGGRFYLSSAPDQLAPVTVDDELAVLVSGVEQWSAFLTYPKVVEVPRSLVEQWAGQPITVIFRDAHASVVGSSPVWLVWMP